MCEQTGSGCLCSCIPSGGLVPAATGLSLAPRGSDWGWLGVLVLCQDFTQGPLLSLGRRVRGDGSSSATAVTQGSSSHTKVSHCPRTGTCAVPLVSNCWVIIWFCFIIKGLTSQTGKKKPNNKNQKPTHNCNAFPFLTIPFQPLVSPDSLWKGFCF